MSIVEEFERFDPDRERQADKTRYPGSKLDVLYDRRRCMHAAECGRASKEVFDAKRSPWIDPDQLDDEEALIRIVQRCPTAAIRAVRPDGTLVEDPVPETNEVTVCPDGPLYVRGRLELHMADGSVCHETRVALCRCGASRNKPFCDGAHSRARFRDAGGVNSDCEGEVGEGGALVIRFNENGLIKMSGPVTLRSASGRPARVGDKLFLCRCGNSANKPFCDGSHKRVGWRSVDGDGR